MPATGVTAGLAAGLLMRLLRLMQHLAWGEGAGGFLRAVEAASPGHRVGVLVLGGLAAGLGRALIRREGSHAGGLAAAVWFRAGRLPFVATVAQGVLSIVVVGLGASLGREAAPKQVGAAFGSLFAGRAGLPPGRHRLFALEVLLGSLALPLVAPALLASGLATAVAWLLLPDRPTYDVPAIPITAGLVAFALAVGPVASVVSAGYVRLVAWADGCKPSGPAVIAAPLAGALLVARALEPRSI